MTFVDSLGTYRLSYLTMSSLLNPNEFVIMRSDVDRIVVTDSSVILLDHNGELDQKRPLSDIEYVVIEEQRKPVIGVLAALSFAVSIYLFIVFNLFVLALGFFFSSMVFWLYRKWTKRVLCLSLSNDQKGGCRIMRLTDRIDAAKNAIEVARFEFLNKATQQTNIRTKTVSMRTVV